MTTTRINKITAALQHAFPNCTLDVIDNSHLHAGHAGAQSGKGHFKICIKSQDLQHKSRIQQHRLIYQALGDLIETDIHALEIEILDD